MLSNLSRNLTYICAVLFFITGAGLFLLPEALATHFAWKVTAFMTMTIGGWCLGFAWLAFVNARRWNWALIYGSHLNMMLFTVGEALVLIAFRSKLVLQHPIAWLYLAAIAAGVLCTFSSLYDMILLRPSIKMEGPSMKPIVRFLVIFFIVFVGFLGLYGLTAAPGAIGTNGGIFPEIMTPFTLRSFGMFYLALALAVVPLFIQKALRPALHHGFAAYGLIIFITIAAFAYVSLFDFHAHPGGLLYFGAYLGVGITTLIVLFIKGTGVSRN
ncbi:MAG: hypothetical protein FJZ86_16260 [Chloroflexi bacterium]|nr:hypothetical protein [Chloroflexota bacterium]